MKRDAGIGPFADVFGYTASVVTALRERVSGEAPREISVGEALGPWTLVLDAKEALDRFEKGGSWTHVLNAKDALEGAIDTMFLRTFGLDLDHPREPERAGPPDFTDHDIGIDL